MDDQNVPPETGRDLSTAVDTLSSLAEISPVGMLLVDAHEEVVHANKAAEELFQRRLIDLSSRRRCGDFFSCLNRESHPEGCGFSPQCAVCPIMTAVRTTLEAGDRRALSGEALLERDTGFRAIRVKYHAKGLRLDSLDYTVISLEDITGQKRSEARLTKQAEFTQRILDATDAHIAVVDEKGKILAVNQSWRSFAQANGAGDERTWGVGADYVRPCAGDDAFIAEAAYEGLRKVQCGELSNFELHYPCHSPDEERWFQMRVLPMPGRPGQVLVSHTNITRLKETEDALREQNANLFAILENTDDLIASRDREGRLVFYNTAFARIVERLFGVEAQPGLITTEQLPPEQQTSWEAILGRVLDGERVQRTFDWDFGGGEVRSYELSLHPIHKGAEIIGSVEFTRDITARKTAEREQRDFRAELILRSKIAHVFLTAGEESVYADILDLLLKAFECEYGYFGFINDTGDLVCPSMTRQVWEACDVPEKGLVFPKEAWGGLWGKSLVKGRAMLRNRDLETPEGHVPLRNALVSPLLLDGEPIGQIALANNPSGYTKEDLRKLESLCEFIGPILRIHIDKETAREGLRKQTAELEEKNTALRVLLEYREEEKQKAADELLQNFEKLVFPYYESMRKSSKNEAVLTYLGIVEENTRECLSKLDSTVSTVYRDFTPTEIQVADLIRAGKTSKDIAELLHLSPRSVYFHRNNIRKKLKIQNKKVNLQSCLSTLP